MQKQTSSSYSDAVNVTTEPDFLAVVLRSLVLLLHVSLWDRRGSYEAFSRFPSSFRPHSFPAIRTDNWTSMRITIDLLWGYENISLATNNIHNAQPFNYKYIRGIKDSVYCL